VKLSLDHILSAAAVFAIGGGALALSAHSSGTVTNVQSAFTASDQAVFDRNFDLADRTCEVGYAAQELCFERSPLESRIVKGEPYPETMYPLALEWRANLALDRKAPQLKTVRLGQTVLLMDRDSRIVVDKMDLSPQRSADSGLSSEG